MCLEVCIDSSFKFTSHISKMSSKIFSAIRVISRVSIYLHVVQRKMWFFHTLTTLKCANLTN